MLLVYSAMKLSIYSQLLIKHVRVQTAELITDLTKDGSVEASVESVSYDHTALTRVNARLYLLLRINLDS